MGLTPDIKPVEEDINIAERLLKSYKLCNYSIIAPDMWTHIKERQLPYLTLLANGDPVPLAEYLCNMHNKDAILGISPGGLVNEELTRQKLIKLAIGTGAISSVGDYSRLSSLIPVIKNLKFKTKNDLKTPDIDGGLWKLDTGAGFYNEKDLDGIYNAWFLCQNCDNPKSVLEIGAGIARTAYWCNKFGIKDYTIIDLPHTNVLQGYYLIKALGSDKVRLYGEERTDNYEVGILPVSCIDRMNTPLFDIVLNQDSFPEIAEPTVLNYLNRIKLISKKFISINQESQGLGWGGFRQHFLPDLIASSGGFKLLLRIPYCVRDGYWVEVYEIE